MDSLLTPLQTSNLMVDGIALLAIEEKVLDQWEVQPADRCQTKLIFFSSYSNPELSCFCIKPKDKYVTRRRASHDLPMMDEDFKENDDCVQVATGPGRVLNFGSVDQVFRD
jgi:hypothetical protein